MILTLWHIPTPDTCTRAHVKNRSNAIDRMMTETKLIGVIEPRLDMILILRHPPTTDSYPSPCSIAVNKPKKIRCNAIDRNWWCSEDKLVRVIELAHSKSGSNYNSYYNQQHMKTLGVPRYHVNWWQIWVSVGPTQVRRIDCNSPIWTTSF